MHVHVIACGGTISAVADERGVIRPRHAGADLLRRAELLGPLPPIQMHDMTPMPSEHATPQFWRELAELVRRLAADPCAAGIVISHGTDTLEETAFFLDLTIDWDRPVVLTGAQRAFSEPDSDGPRNLYQALQAAQSRALYGAGVLVAFGGAVHAARAVTKVHTTACQAFDSGSAGAVATIDQERISLHGLPPRFRTFERTEIDGRADIIAVYPGADATLVEAAVSSGADGLVVAAYGCGNVNPPVYHALVEAIRRDVTVVIASRVPWGAVFPAYGLEGGGASIARAGAIFAQSLPPHKARILLLVALANGLRGQDLADVFAAFEAGESLPAFPVGLT